MIRTLRRPVAILFAALLTLSLAAPTLAIHQFDDQEHPFDKDVFHDRWERTDGPVAEGDVDRSWVWGPESYTAGMIEPYLDSSGGFREVQYFQKSRMELNDPRADRDDLWTVTNGLLVVEMVEGWFQIGHDEFDESPDPAEFQIAGDPENEYGPTYADINELGLRDMEPYELDSVIDQTLEDGEVVSGEQYAEYDVTAAHHVQVPEIDHTVASVFWDFMNSEGAVVEDGEQIEDRLFPNPFYATGYPITEALWTTVQVNGEERDVLWQCFERRCLTYTPDNPDGWQVEAGNVGQHYFQWRYGEAGPQTETVELFLYLLGDAGEQGIEFGCDDSLVPIEGEIQQHDEINLRVAAALQALFNAEDDELNNVFTGEGMDVSIEAVNVMESTATVTLAGPLVIGGVCDEPRVEEQIRHTVLQFEEIEHVVILYQGGPLFPSQEQPTHGVVAIFDVLGEQFRVWVTNEDTIDDLFALQAGESMANIPNGVIHHGPGEFNHNQPWSWHLDPEEIEMAEMTIELCDGTPTFIESEVDYFVETVGQYCPWSAELVEIIDYR
jgi:hypothetical protein